MGKDFNSIGTMLSALDELNGVSLGFNVDEYGTIYNCEDNYQKIADYLSEGKSLLLAWTDQEGTQYDLLLVHQPIKQGPIQRGIRRNDMIVSIMSVGAFGFSTSESAPDSVAGYIEDKFGRKMGSTAEKLAELINNVRVKL